MNIERITVAFHAEDDRLMMRVFFDQKAEFQSWLTRRLAAPPGNCHVGRGDFSLGGTPDRVGALCALRNLRASQTSGGDFILHAGGCDHTDFGARV